MCVRVSVSVYKQRDWIQSPLTAGSIFFPSPPSLQLPLSISFSLCLCVVYMCFCTLPSIKTIQLGRLLTPRQPFNDIYWNFQMKWRKKRMLPKNDNIFGSWFFNTMLKKKFIDLAWKKTVWTIQYIHKWINIWHSMIVMWIWSFRQHSFPGEILRRFENQHLHNEAVHSIRGISWADNQSCKILNYSNKHMNY